jgi:hypothetical protein
VIETVECDVRAPNCIRIALGDHAAVVVEYPAEMMLLDEVSEDPPGLVTDLPMTRFGHRHRDNPSPDQLFPITWVGALGEPLGGEEGFGLSDRGHGAILLH